MNPKRTYQEEDRLRAFRGQVLPTHSPMVAFTPTTMRTLHLCMEITQSPAGCSGRFRRDPAGEVGSGRSIREAVVLTSADRGRGPAGEIGVLADDQHSSGCVFRYSYRRYFFSKPSSSLVSSRLLIRCISISVSETAHDRPPNNVSHYNSTQYKCRNPYHYRPRIHSRYPLVECLRYKCHQLEGSFDVKPSHGSLINFHCIP
ncbi:hypothetical protein QBC36DRAFT_125729 [Triangularia setosa]|uniref:Uncharacterized protein n=1 Tax=Triangularia setosa TaxID=2587417 RepID=A0AAN6VXQ7_9PEZI|nr:hypothetical protein QBC36DRAFT_125729 [Podospora setosa]